MIKLTLVVVVVLVIAFQFELVPPDKGPEIIRRQDGGWAEITGDAQDVKDFNVDGQMARHIYVDSTGVRHTVTYGDDGMIDSHVRTE